MNLQLQHDCFFDVELPYLTLPYLTLPYLMHMHMHMHMHMLYYYYGYYLVIQVMSSVTFVTLEFNIDISGNEA